MYRISCLCQILCISIVYLVYYYIISSCHVINIQPILGHGPWAPVGKKVRFYSPKYLEGWLSIFL